MKRPNSVLTWLLAGCALLAAGEYAALMWLAPQYVMRVVEHAAGGELTIDGASLTFPLTTSMTQLRLVANTSESAFTVQRAVIKPRWISLPSKTLWIDAVELERPLLRITRTKAGTWVWPAIRISPSIEPALASTQPAGKDRKSVV